MVPQTVCETQTVQCIKKVPYTVCRQVPVTRTECVPVQVTRKVTECKTVCVPKTICKQVPVTVECPVPVTVHCPAAGPALVAVPALAAEPGRAPEHRSRRSPPAATATRSTCSSAACSATRRTEPRSDIHDERPGDPSGSPGRSRFAISSFASRSPRRSCGEISSPSSTSGRGLDSRSGSSYKGPARHTAGALAMIDPAQPNRRDLLRSTAAAGMLPLLGATDAPRRPDPRGERQARHPRLDEHERPHRPEDEVSLARGSRGTPRGRASGPARRSRSTSAPTRPRRS